MKHILALLSGAALLTLTCACDMQAQPNYSVTFAMPQGSNASNTMAYLMDYDSSLPVDSVIVTGDTVKFEGTVDTPFIGRIMLGGQRGPVLFVEPGAITFDEQYNAKGTPLNDKQLAAFGQFKKYEEEYRTLNQEDSIAALRAQEIMNLADNFPMANYEANKNNPLGLFWYLQAAYDMPVEQIEADMAANPTLGQSKRLKSVVEAAKLRAKTAVGQHYLDFTVDYDGKAQKFSDYVKPGEYTLVDFWASWCGPCMRQAKVIKELYNRFKDKGLNVVGVAVWDEPEATLAAIKSHGLEWPNIINAQTVPTDLYGINGIPCILLINPEGIIVSRDKQGDDLVADVEKAMAEYHPETSEAEEVKPTAEADTAVIF